jgi:Flp pilus assembly protein TadG
MHINAYDNIRNTTSVKPQSVSGSSAVNGVSVDTLGYDNAKLHAFGVAASGSPSGASLAVKLQESADGSTNWADALDNTGVGIGFTLTTTAADAVNAARIEGLNLNRKRYLRAVVTPTFTGGTSPASQFYAEIVFGGDAQQLPVNSATSNT